MKAIKIFVALIALGMLLVVFYCAARVYSSPTSDLNIQALAIGLIVSIIMGGAGMLNSLFLMDRTALRLQIRNGFASEEMGIAMTRLGKFGRECGNDYHQIAKRFGEMLKKLPDEDIPDEKLTEEEYNIRYLNRSRRKYSHYFYGIYNLSDEVFSNFIKKIVSVDEVQLLLEVVEPMEKAKNPDYNMKMINKFRKIFRKKLNEK